MILSFLMCALFVSVIMEAIIHGYLPLSIVISIFMKLFSDYSVDSGKPFELQCFPMLLTIPQVAERLNISRQRVHKLVAEGRIRAQRVGRVAAIKDTEVQRFKKIKRANGRPRS